MVISSAKYVIMAQYVAKPVIEALFIVMPAKVLAK